MFMNYIYPSLCNNSSYTSSIFLLFSVFLLSFYIILLNYSLTYFVQWIIISWLKSCAFIGYQHAWKYWTNVWELLYTMQYSRQPPFNVSIILFPSFISLEYSRETYGASTVAIVVKHPLSRRRHERSRLGFLELEDPLEVGMASHSVFCLLLSISVSCN